MKQDWQSRVLQSDFVLHRLRSLRSTCWAEFVMTLCWNMILCKVSQRGPPPRQQRWCSCLSTGRGRVMWSTMASSTATRQTRQTKYWRCVKRISSLLLTFYICAVRLCCMSEVWMKQGHSECSHRSTTNHFKIADCDVSDFIFICFGLRTDSTSLQGLIWLYFLWYSASKVQRVPKA